MDFRNAYAHGFARVAACTLPVALADPATNAERVITAVKQCHDDHVAVALFPELSLSGYAIDDLLMQDVLLEAVDDAVVTIAEATAKLLPLVVVGAPLRHGNRLYNCARRHPPRRGARRRAEVASCPTTASSTRSASSPPGRGTRASSSCGRTGPVPTSTARSPSAPT